ncbi:hypothetical protein D7U36_02815 [Propionibacterium australiense]|uniref:RecC C-terminal domain-containing protein n=2 Tax=Propionibacterium australiense TaxID=119981 RepID=A0A8B3FL90_9ACTN|nr:hypothetical protein D7U36_02815 [Propionibacterium australiense]
MSAALPKVMGMTNWRSPAGQGGAAVIGCHSWTELCARAGEFLAAHATDPFTVPVLVAPSAAHSRSIRQTVAAAPGGPGVFAGVDTPSMGGLRARLERDLLGHDTETDPWRSAGLAIQVASLMRECSTEPWFALVQRHIEGHPARGEAPRPAPGRLIATAEGYAGLVRNYCRHRPAMLRAWSQGSLVDPAGDRLPEHDQWQALLWQRLAASLDWPHPGLRHEQLCAAIQRARPDALPPALGVACLDVPCETDVELLTALAGRLPVSVWQLGSPDWAAADSKGSPLRERYGSARRLSWQRWIGTTAAITAPAEPDPGPSTMLGRLQHHVRIGRPVGELVEADGSVSIHASHGPDRQVEVLREALCDAFDRDPALQPRDVIVLCTDLPAYAPLLEAALGPVDTPGQHPGHDLRARVAGSATERPNQVLTVLLTLLALPSARATSAELLALASLSPVARAFGFDAEALDRIGQLVERSQIRWGVDSRHRAAHGLSGVRQGTWITGIDRLLAGLVMADDPLTRLNTVVPVDHLSGSDAELIGSMAELVSRVRMHLLRFDEPADIVTWRTRLLEAATDLAGNGPDDQWMLNHLSSALFELSCAAGAGSLLDAGDVAAALRHLVRPQRGRADFGAGSMTICGLGDAQGIDHEVVAILGLDDAHFPPRTTSAGGDLLARAGILAQDTAAAARQQLLDAVLSAGKRLIVVGAGADPCTGEMLPQPVVMSDLIAACTGQEAGEPWRQAHAPDAGRAPSLIHVHPLQPYAAANFDPDRAGGAFSFDAAALAGARAAAEHPSARRQEPVWTITGAPPGEEAHVVGVDELVSFFQDPIRAWVLHSFGFLPGAEADQAPTDLPITLDGLESWAVDESITTALIAGQSPTAALDAALLGGRVPPGRLGTTLLGERRAALEAYATTVRAQLTAPAEHDVAWQEGHWSVSGTISSYAGRLVHHRYARLRGRHLAAAWVELVCATAAGADVDEALVIGRNDCFRLAAPSPAAAQSLLSQMCRLRRTGLSRFLPMPPDTCLSHARRASRNQRSAASFLPRDYAREVGFSPVLQWVSASWRDIEAIDSEPEDPLTTSPSRFVNLSRWFYGPLVGALSPWNPGAHHD